MDWFYERLNELVESGEMTEEEACGRVAIKDREDLFKLIEKHIANIEG